VTARSVADVLISFGAREPPAAAGGSAAVRDATSLASEAAVEAHAEAIASAREEGIAAGLARAAAANEAALEAERGAFAAQLAGERDRWARDEGHVLADKIAGGLVEIETRIAAHTARTLRGFLADRLIDRATRELAQHIHALLRGSDGKVVQVCGPADLVAALSEKLEGEPAAIEFRPGASADIRIVCDDTLVESRLGAWLARLASEVE
jgi:hypothetical protein